MKNFLVDIVIVNWNSGSYLKRCVSSLFEHPFEKLQINVSIIDNKSTDGSININSSHKQIEILYNTRNQGFSSACNQGATRGTAKYILFLNPDALTTQETVYKAVNYLHQHPAITILGVKHLNENGKVQKSCSRISKPRTIFNDILGLSKIAPNIFLPSTTMADWDHMSSRYVDQVMGAFFLIRRIDFEYLKGFDERFFVYFEDMDLSLRVLRQGGKIYYKADLEITHTGMGTTHNITQKRLEYSIRSRLLFIKKHYSYFNYVWIKFFTFTFEPITRSIFLCFSGKVNEVAPTLRAFISLYRKS